MQILTKADVLAIINEKRPPLSLYEWVKQNPKKHIIAMYRNIYPKILSEKASRFSLWFKTYPGDGVLFFHDSLLSSSISLSSIEHQTYNIPDEYIKLFQYLYSFQKDFSLLSKSVLALFLLKCPILSIPLYKYRKQFDPQNFTNFINSMNKYKSLLSYTSGTASKYVTQFIWQTIFDHQVPVSICDNSIFLHLYYGYTYQAIQRFFLLSNSRIAVKNHIIIAYNTYRQTHLLLNTWQENPITMINQKNRPIQQMSSIKAMQKFHDLKTEDIIRQQRIREQYCYTWDDLTKIIQEISPEWYIPDRLTDIRMRGLVHHNCVGAYAKRHFESVIIRPGIKKTILLFSDFYEAEVTIAFAELFSIKGEKFMGCSSAKLQQATTEYNKAIPSSELIELKKVAKAFYELPAEYFNPKKVLINK